MDAEAHQATADRVAFAGSSSSLRRRPSLAFILAGIGITTAAIGRGAGAQRAQANSVHRAAHVGGGGGARMARPMSGMGGGVRSAGAGNGRISPRASSITSIGVRPSRLTVHSPAVGA
jgi:hypothetical protein